MKKLNIYLILILYFVVLNVANSQNWLHLGSGVNSFGVDCLYNDTINNRLFAGGRFTNAGGINCKNIAFWNNQNWDTIASFESYSINSFLHYNGNLYAAGNFNITNGSIANNIASWNGSSWSGLNNGVDKSIYDLRQNNNNLCAVGAFYTADSIPSRCIAFWNDSIWIPMDTTIWHLSTIWTVGNYKNELYIGGAWSTGYDSLDNILRWDGQQWKSLGKGIKEIGDGIMDGIRCFEIFNNKLIIGGNFEETVSNHTPGNSIVSWDGQNFDNMGGGIFGEVRDMAVFNGELYVVGAFSKAGGVTAYSIAKWTGQEWCSLGSSFNGSINAIEVYNNELYVAGIFTNIDGIPINRIAKWNGGSYVDTCGVINNINIINQNELLCQIHPNPAQNYLNIQLNNPLSKDLEIQFYDIVGKQIKSYSLKNVQSTYQIDISELKAGVYFVKVSVYDGEFVLDKFVKL